jgi:hypothetical protein
MNGKSCSIPNAAMTGGAHWYPTDCAVCHKAPSTTAISLYSGNAKWTYSHSQMETACKALNGGVSCNRNSTVTPVSCVGCHANGCN